MLLARPVDCSISSVSARAISVESLQSLRPRVWECAGWIQPGSVCALHALLGCGQLALAA